MGTKEMVLLVVALVLGGIMALAVGPSIFGYGSGTKAALESAEIGTIKSTAKAWINGGSTDNTFNGVTAQAIATYIPSMTLTGTGATSTLTSRQNSAVTYLIAAATTTLTNDSLKITVAGANTAEQTKIFNDFNQGECTSTAVGASPFFVTCKG